MFNGFSYAAPLRTHVTHYESILDETHIKQGRKEKFLCFIKTLKGIYTSIFVFLLFCVLGDREVVRSLKLLEQTQTQK